MRLVDHDLGLGGVGGVAAQGRSNGGGYRFGSGQLPFTIVKAMSLVLPSWID
jgi:hypothetical protein